MFCLFVSFQSKFFPDQAILAADRRTMNLRNFRKWSTKRSSDSEEAAHSQASQEEEAQNGDKNMYKILLLKFPA
jgi:hypothetical protein